MIYRASNASPSFSARLPLQLPSSNHGFEHATPTFCRPPNPFAASLDTYVVACPLPKHGEKFEGNLAQAIDLTAWPTPRIPTPFFASPLPTNEFGKNTTLEHYSSTPNRARSATERLLICERSINGTEYGVRSTEHYPRVHTILSPCPLLWIT